MIDELEGVVESAVIGVPHPDFGEAVSAVVVPAHGAALDETARDRRGARSPGELQGAQARLVRPEPAAQRHGQGAEERAARAAPGHLLIPRVA